MGKIKGIFGPGLAVAKRNDTVWLSNWPWDKFANSIQVCIQWYCTISSLHIHVLVYHSDSICHTNWPSDMVVAHKFCIKFEHTLHMRSTSLSSFEAHCSTSARAAYYSKNYFRIFGPGLARTHLHSISITLLNLLSDSNTTEQSLALYTMVRNLKQYYPMAVVWLLTLGLLVERSGGHSIWKTPCWHLSHLV